MKTTHSDFSKTFPAAQVRADLDFLQKALYAGHQGIFLFTSKDSMDLFFDRLREHMPSDSVTYDHAQVLFRLAIAKVCDGHTSLQTPFFDDSTRVLPLTVNVEGERVFLLSNFSGDTTLRPGDELLAVNGLPVASVVRAGYLITSADGLHDSFRAALASVYFARHLRLLYGPRETFKVLVERRGIKSEHQVRARSRADILRQQQAKDIVSARKRRPLKPLFRNREQALFRDSLHHDLAVLKMTDFETYGYRRFYRRTFAWLQHERIPNLVIDLRFNTGGDIRNMGRLTAYILDQDFRYDYRRRRHTHLSRYFGLGGKAYIFSAWLKYRVLPGLKHRRTGDLNISTRRVKARRRHNFDGQVFVLTDGFSFSSASMCASFLKNLGEQVTIIGTETGGAEAGNCGGGFPSLRLPNTRWKVRFPLYYLSYQIGKENRGQGVAPDVVVARRIEHLITRKDGEMEEVYRIINKQ